LVLDQDKYPRDKDRKKVSNGDLSGIVDEFPNCKKTVDNDLSKSVLIENDLMKFSTTNAHEAVNNQMKHTSSSILVPNPAEIKKEISSPIVQKSPKVTYYYEYKELSSQELPVFLNMPKYEEFVSNETLNSSDVPFCVKDLSLQ